MHATPPPADAAYTCGAAAEAGNISEQQRGRLTGMLEYMERRIPALGGAARVVAATRRGAILGLALLHAACGPTARPGAAHTCTWTVRLVADGVVSLPGTNSASWLLQYLEQWAVEKSDL